MYVNREDVIAIIERQQKELCPLCKRQRHMGRMARDHRRDQQIRGFFQKYPTFVSGQKP